MTHPAEIRRATKRVPSAYGHLRSELIQSAESGEVLRGDAIEPNVGERKTGTRLAFDTEPSRRAFNRPCEV
jgi:hypothetical protein